MNNIQSPQHVYVAHVDPQETENCGCVTCTWCDSCCPDFCCPCRWAWNIVCYPFNVLCYIATCCPHNKATREPVYVCCWTKK